MKINSKPYAKLYPIVLTFAIMAILANMVLSFFQGSLTDSWYLGTAGIIVLILMVFRGPSEFKYDSEGEVLNFTTTDPIWGKLFKNYNKHYEFPKRRLNGYKIRKGLLRRRLIIFIKSRSGGIKERSMLISHLSSSQLSSLANSLKKYSHKSKNGGRKSGKSSRESRGATD
jgi:hypothetical protein